MASEAPLPATQGAPASAAETSTGVLARLIDVDRTFKLGASQVHALQGVSLDIHEGNFVMLRGRSGSGKTTLLNIIGGLDRPTKGKVIINGKELSSFSDRALTKWRRREVGFVFQSFALIPSLTAYENVELPLRIIGIHGRARRARIKECLELVGLWTRAKHRTFELSGGEQQRVSIARALTTRPRLLLADEPTGELDFLTGQKILGLFQEIVRSEGITICMVTHDPNATPFADVVYSLADGKLVQD